LKKHIILSFILLLEIGFLFLNIDHFWRFIPIFSLIASTLFFIIIKEGLSIIKQRILFITMSIWQLNLLIFVLVEDPSDNIAFVLVSYIFSQVYLTWPLSKLFYNKPINNEEKSIVYYKFSLVKWILTLLGIWLYIGFYSYFENIVRIEDPNSNSEIILMFISIFIRFVLLISFFVGYVYISVYWYWVMTKKNIIFIYNDKLIIEKIFRKKNIIPINILQIMNLSRNRVDLIWVYGEKSKIIHLKNEYSISMFELNKIISCHINECK